MEIQNTSFTPVRGGIEHERRTPLEVIIGGREVERKQWNRSVIDFIGYYDADYI
jgi:hypothetical protein